MLKNIIIQTGLCYFELKKYLGNSIGNVSLEPNPYFSGYFIIKKIDEENVYIVVLKEKNIKNVILNIETIEVNDMKFVKSNNNNYFAEKYDISYERIIKEIKYFIEKKPIHLSNKFNIYFNRKYKKDSKIFHIILFGEGKKKSSFSRIEKDIYNNCTECVIVTTGGFECNYDVLEVSKIGENKYIFELYIKGPLFSILNKVKINETEKRFFEILVNSYIKKSLKFERSNCVI